MAAPSPSLTSPSHSPIISLPGLSRHDHNDENSDNVIDVALAPKPFKSHRLHHGHHHHHHHKHHTPSTNKKHKNLKQIMALERSDRLDIPTYWSIEAAPSVRPKKKYCDITGLEARYTDPRTGLRYHNADVYQYIQTLTPQLTQSYLALRNADVPLI
ncbi:YL1 nuclear protein C-terminal domain-containing protein [Polychytrium aggregatum]|uniref:YL1 nuclear protein C-terminal domain-containing protein n=1 Tax=Polychytrium aggregatum TaxID=110093 RepID=UPI0022FDF4FF|nr:YL1 nuclear protein C-terminal domain-containing protein [Polychytrium aggregatum]KAI9193286.1 YL1 nuclear protein C-terminal domain-containing protein [Polychytrium aggregatum]